MKNLIVSFATVLVTSLSVNATVTENFNHGSECYSWMNCWAFCNVDVRSRSYGCNPDSH